MHYVVVRQIRSILQFMSLAGDSKQLSQDHVREAGL
jgi:hypothetical protein